MGFLQCPYRYCYKTGSCLQNGGSILVAHCKAGNIHEGRKIVFFKWQNCGGPGSEFEVVSKRG